VASGERTEAPTPRRREEIRKRGNVPKSTELNSVLVLLACTLIIRATGPNVLSRVLQLMDYSFRHLATGDWTLSQASIYGGMLGGAYLSIMVPVFVAITLVGVGSNLLQSGLVLTARPLGPDFSRIDPLKGLQRVFSLRSIVELMKAIIKLAVISYVVYQVFQERYFQITSMVGTDIYRVAGALGDAAMEILFKAGLALLAVAVLDYGYQRWEYERNARMTRQEVKEEYRQSEGDPKVRSKIRQQQRQMAARRMMHDVPASDVVITNPTHLAVALQYRPEAMRAPKVTAKGQLLVAERIKEIARQHGVPVIENKPLAQALFKSVDVGCEVPPDLYRAVAEVLVFIYQLRRERRLGGYPVGS